jgi:hypothetical protein
MDIQLVNSSLKVTAQEIDVSEDLLKEDKSLATVMEIYEQETDESNNQ